jgi:hypothetical protein
MDADAAEWVVYRLPKPSSHGQASRIRDPRKAWPVVQRFIAALTRATLGPRVTLTCFQGEPRNVTVAKIEEALRCFGAEAGPSGGFPSWTLNEAQLPSAIQFVLDDDKLPKQKFGLFGPSWITFSYRFFWTEFDHAAAGLKEAELQRMSSHLTVTIGQQRLLLQPLFVYPAAWMSQSLKDFIERSEPLAPFRFQNQNFKRWVSPQTTSRDRLLRLEPDWRQRSESY